MLDHQRDLWADFRAFYHLDPAAAQALPGPEYFALAFRAPAFRGAMRAQLERDHEVSGGRPGGSTTAPPVRDVPLGAAGIQPDADGLPLHDLFDLG